MGAWIETSAISRSTAARISSHPTWVRGLKLEERALTATVGMSHPTWVRGLKQTKIADIQRQQGRTLRGCVD